MSTAENKAVFLSYASQDAEAAQRIAEALRAAGAEVWFDRNELVGGDAWDAKIRKQIAKCALFVPIISANTQARTEGYFRLEWKLAAQRTHMIADDAAFLLPVVIDDTRDAGARVPAEFKAVQWTRLRPGDGGQARDEALEKFGARVTLLLGGSAALPPAPDAGEHGLKHHATSEPGRRMPVAAWLAVAALVVGAVGYFALRPGPAAGAAPLPPAVEKPTAATALTEAQKFVRQARALLDDDLMQLRENYFLADELAQRAVKADPADGEAWAIAGRASALMIRRRFDVSPARKDQARMQVERAMSLAPASIESAFAQALQQDAAGRTAEAQGILDELTKRAPADWRLWDALGELNLRAKQVEPALSCFRQAQTLSGGDARPASGEIRALLRLGRLAEARERLTQVLAGKPGRGAYLAGLLFSAIYTYDVAATKAFIEKIPPRVMQEDSMISTLAEFFLRTGEGDRALEELKRMSRDFFEDGWDWRPKGYLAGYAHQVAGRPTAAQAEWKQALAVVEKRLAAEPNETALLYWKCLLQALTGRIAEARAGRTLLRELEKDDSGWFDSILLVAVGDREVAIDLLAQRWPKAENSLRNDLWADWLYGPWFAPIRDDPRIRAMALEHKAAIDRALQPGAAAAPAPKADEKSVAVLAFANLSDDKANEYFSDGISEELLNVLAKVPGLKVTARTSAFSFKGKNMPMPEIGRQLSVAYVVEGSVRKAGDKVRITAQLIKAADGFHVWSDTFTRDLKDIFAVQDEIAGLIAQNISPKLTRSASAGSSRQVDPEAFQRYLEGRALATKAGLDQLREAIALFERAVQLDPGFHLARVQMARAYVQLGRWGGMVPREAWEAAKAALAPALAAEPDAPEVLVAQGWLLRTADWKWREAEQAYARALAQRPGDTDVLVSAAVLKTGIGKSEEAHALARRALELDPLNPATQFDLGLIYRFSDRLPEAERQFRRAIELAPTGQRYRTFLALVVVALGRMEEAEELARNEPDELSREFVFGLAAAARGDQARLRQIIAQLDARRSTLGKLGDYNAYLGSLRGAAGDLDGGMAELEAARAARDPSIGWVKVNYIVRSLHQHPRWNDFLRTLGLADDQLK